MTYVRVSWRKSGILRSDIIHQYLFFDSLGHPIDPRKAVITRFGSFAQISQRLVQRLEKLGGMRGEKSEAEWMACLKSLVT